MLLRFLDVLFSYRDQFAMLAEGIARERYEMEVRDKAQEKVSYRPNSTVAAALFIKLVTLKSFCQATLLLSSSS